MRKKKVMFFLYALSGGGAERTIINIINNLNKEKFDVVLVLGTTENNDYMELLKKDINLISLNSKKLRRCIFKLRSTIINENPDLLFSTINANNIILLLAKLLTLNKTPIIVREASNRTQSGKVSLINRILTRLLYNNVANHIVSLSLGVKKDLVENFQVRESKISLIYNPVEIDMIKELSNDQTLDIVKSKNEKLLIAVGRLVDAKDFKVLIEAFSKVNKIIKSRLIIVGKGSLESNLKELAIKLDVNDKVDFLGFKKNPYKYMKTADLFILSSKYEGFGHVIVEAMATGTAVLSTNCNSGPNEIIEDNKNGKLVPVGNSKEMAKEIINLLTNEEILKKFSRNGLKRANDFNAIKITKEYERLFEKVLGNKNTLYDNKNLG